MIDFHIKKCVAGMLIVNFSGENDSHMHMGENNINLLTLLSRLL